MPAPSPFASMLPLPALPTSLKQAIARGIVGKCPRCEEGKLFARFLKPAPHCSACGQDWSHHRADDFPPYVSIFLTGHLLAPVIIALASSDALPLWACVALCMALGAAIMLALLQPAKGGIIALQWWLGMHGFNPAGRDEARTRQP